MTNQARTPFEISQAIRSSAGQRVLDREHARSFSLNIFRTNARELLEALRHVSDPENGLHLMAISNREAGTQAHREVSRRVHNFVAASKTLVDQTRTFMKEHYGQTPIWTAYNNEANKRFSEIKVVKFVHDLRNYMLHRALPNSSMFMHYYRDPEQPDQGGHLTTGVRFDATELSDWDGWTKPAREYLQSVGDEVSIEAFTSAYVSLVETFQVWINDRLAKFHAADMAELEALHKEYAESEIEEQREAELIEDIGTPNAASADLVSNVLSSSASTEINNLADELLAGIHKLDLAPTRQTQFKSDRPAGVKIRPEKMVEDPILWGEDGEGDQVLAFILRQSATYGFDSVSLPVFWKLKDLILGVEWAEQKLGNKSIEKIIIDWCRSSFDGNKKVNLSEAITTAGRTRVMSLDVWAPIAHLEIECGFSFGPVDIQPITAEMINNLETEALKCAHGQEADIRALFDKLRSTMQGYAAVVVRLEASNERAGGTGLTIAREAVDLLRFFSPAASDASLVSPIALLGSQSIPESNVLVLGEGTFSYSTAVIPNGVVYWQLSKQRLAELKQIFSVAAQLIRAENLDDFERAIRSGMMMLSTASTLIQPLDRLVYTLSAMERVLLKHEMEAAAYSVEERMSQLLANDTVAADKISHNVRAVYRLRATHSLSQWSEFNSEALQMFVSNAYQVLLIALQNIANFSTCADFIETIERQRRA